MQPADVILPGTDKRADQQLRRLDAIRRSVRNFRDRLVEPEHDKITAAVATAPGLPPSDVEILV